MNNEYVLLSNGGFVSTDELYHYGVLGMKWGIRKANRTFSKNATLTRKALKYDAKSAKYTKKSEKQHALRDLDVSNRAATKGAAYMKRAAKVRKRSLKKDDYKQVMTEKKASKLEYKAAKKIRKGNRISKTTGYGVKAMKYSIKSDKFAIKAAKARRKIANNKAYVSMMNRRISTLDSNTLRKIEDSLSQYQYLEQNKN